MLIVDDQRASGEGQKDRDGESASQLFFAHPPLLSKSVGTHAGRELDWPAFASAVRGAPALVSFDAPTAIARVSFKTHLVIDALISGLLSGSCHHQLQSIGSSSSVFARSDK